MVVCKAPWDMWGAPRSIPPLRRMPGLAGGIILVVVFCEGRHPGDFKATARRAPKNLTVILISRNIVCADFCIGLS